MEEKKKSPYKLLWNKNKVSFSTHQIDKKKFY